MDNIEITAQPGLGIIPSHKISITQGSDVYVYWYVKAKLDSRNFENEG